MNNATRQIQYFLFSQDFSDGVRITLAVLLPPLVLGQLGQLETGISLSIGALCISLIDSPGPVKHKRNGMLYGNLAIFLVALLTGFARLSPWTMGLEVLVLSFLFTMFNVYGNRAAALGSAALLIMILNMDRPLTPPQVLTHSLLTLLGGIWYMALGLLIFRVWPYRPAQQAIGECVHAIAQFLRIKANFYHAHTDLDRSYRQLVAQQVVVSEKQEAVRELLFKTRQIVRESTPESRRLLLTFIDVVDLYEHITTTYYDYAALRTQFQTTGVLAEVGRMIEQLAEELDTISLAMQSNRAFHARANHSQQLEHLQAHIEAVGQQHPEVRTLVLKKLLVNLRNLVQRLEDVLGYFNAPAPAPTRRTTEVEYGRFVSHQDYGLGVLRSNLTFKSAVFRHAVRVLLASGVAFLVAKLVFAGSHSYWIVMTAVYMLKPAFSLTKKRNYERIIGTLLGGFLGVLLLVSITSQPLQFAFLLLLMVLSFSFQRRHYLTYVTFITSFVVVMLSFLGGSYLAVAQERLLDTVVGCVIALTAGYLLFPNWESEQLRDYMGRVLSANRRYLQQLAESLAGRPPDFIPYRLARKEVYVSSANLAAAFQRMLSEPKSKQQRSEDVHQFVVLNHILSSNIATLSAAVRAQPSLAPSVEVQRALRRALAALTTSLQKLTPAAPPESAPALPAAPAERAEKPPTADDRQVLEQLEFIQKVSGDISRVTEAVLA
ncbi:membrane protein [Hymenobacter qilianensis]|uniref:Membrane protein n=1 Tax=Hymenobacter qilianensis TaxID=1385715 RepID=A0ACB5PWB4_9BACT|nr:FUSC family membrane protein [Hymenobacter qilianensis]GGF78552.1 membrane protein [Hymenobacter qilianensis]